MTRFRIRLILAALLLLLLPAACVSEPQGMHVTFSSDGSCAYTGQTSIPFGQFTIDGEIKDAAQDGYALFVFSLSDGKSADDFRSWAESTGLQPGTMFPEWITTIAFDLLPSSGTFRVSADLRHNAAYDGSPLYIACFSTEALIGVLGPFEVIK